MGERASTPPGPARPTGRRKVVQPATSASAVSAAPRLKARVNSANIVGPAPNGPGGHLRDDASAPGLPAGAATPPSRLRRTPSQLSMMSETTPGTRARSPVNLPSSSRSVVGGSTRTPGVSSLPGTPGLGLSPTPGVRALPRGTPSPAGGSSLGVGRPPKVRSTSVVGIPTPPGAASPSPSLGGSATAARIHARRASITTTTSSPDPHVRDRESRDHGRAQSAAGVSSGSSPLPSVGGAYGGATAARVARRASFNSAERDAHARELRDSASGRDTPEGRLSDSRDSPRPARPHVRTSTATTTSAQPRTSLRSNFEDLVSRAQSPPEVHPYRAPRHEPSRLSSLAEVSPASANMTVRTAIAGAPPTQRLPSRSPSPVKSVLPPEPLVRPGTNSPVRHAELAPPLSPPEPPVSAPPVAAPYRDLSPPKSAPVSPPLHTRPTLFPPSFTHGTHRPTLLSPSTMGPTFHAGSPPPTLDAGEAAYPIDLNHLAAPAPRAPFGSAMLEEPSSNHSSPVRPPARMFDGGSPLNVVFPRLNVVPHPAASAPTSPVQPSSLALGHIGAPDMERGKSRPSRPPLPWNPYSVPPPRFPHAPDSPELRTVALPTMTPTRSHASTEDLASLASQPYTSTHPPLSFGNLLGLPDSPERPRHHYVSDSAHDPDASDNSQTLSSPRRMSSGSESGHSQGDTSPPATVTIKARRSRNSLGNNRSHEYEHAHVPQRNTRDRLSGSTVADDDAGQAKHNLESVMSLDAEKAKVERKIADLEISNASLLAINRTLEATKAKQRTEILKLRRQLRDTSLEPPAPLAPASNGLSLQNMAKSDDEEGYSPDEMGDPELERRWDRLADLVGAMRRRGEDAIERGTDDPKPGVQRVLGWLEVEAQRAHDGSTVPSEIDPTESSIAPTDAGTDAGSELDSDSGSDADTEVGTELTEATDATGHTHPRTAFTTSSIE